MIYVVEDDRNIRELMVYMLNNSGYKALGLCDGRELMEQLEKAGARLILLDIMLPGEDGISILTRLRANRDTAEIPVIMVSARGSEYDRVLGLDTGADDYISKPFGMMELMARVRAVLRRFGQKEENSLSCENVVVYPENRQVFVRGQEVALTFKEFEVLHFLLENKGKAMTREKLLESVWGYDYVGETRTVDVHIGTLRQKLELEGAIIETVRGVGYKIGGK